MNVANNKLSSLRIDRIKEQGYFSKSDEEINELAYGNRFAYRLCVSILIVGVVFSNISVLITMMTIAFLGVVLPNHPLDYIYNGLLSKRMGKPNVPPRSMQLKFACTMATVVIGATILPFYNNMTLFGYLLGGSIIGVAILVSSIDLCIPSKMYNAIFLSNRQTEQVNS